MENFWNTFADQHPLLETIAHYLLIILPWVVILLIAILNPITLNLILMFNHRLRSDTLRQNDLIAGKDPDNLTEHDLAAKARRVRKKNEKGRNTLPGDNKPTC
jgi:hypothetical protein